MREGQQAEIYSQVTQIRTTAGIGGQIKPYNDSPQSSHHMCNIIHIGGAEICKLQSFTCMSKFCTETVYSCQINRSTSEPTQIGQELPIGRALLGQDLDTSVLAYDFNPVTHFGSLLKWHQPPVMQLFRK